MEPHIQYAQTADGVSIAYATAGSGLPMVVVPGWLSHLEIDWRDKLNHSLFEHLASERQLVRYDKRGTGLSDRNLDNYSLDAQVGDLEAIVEQLQLHDVVLLGCCQGGPIAINYAALHPENVSALILYGTYHSGKQWREAVPGRVDAFTLLIREDWGRYGASTMLEALVPGAPPEFRQMFAEYQRQTASPEDAASALKTFMEYEVTHLLSQIAVPTLVLHRRDEEVPFQQGREIASRIRGARFVPLEGNIHPIWLGDTKPIISAIKDFLGEDYEPAVEPFADFHADVYTILFTDMEGSTTLTQRLGDAKAQDLLRTHNRIVRDALKAHSGSEIKHTGDGIMASFASASRALECSIAIQRALAQHNESNPDIPIRVRIGLNAGEPVAEEEDLFGTAVQLAARICAQAGPGEILAPIVVRELAAGKGFLFSDLGDVALRGFEDPVRLYEVGWRA